MFGRGYWTVFHWKGVPVRIHWSAPVAAFVFGHFRFVPGFWLGFVAIVVIHELGHAAVVLANRARVSRVDVHGLGGVCWWSGPVTRLGRAAIAWGGVWAQIAAWIAAAIWFREHPPESGFAAQLEWVFGDGNLWLMGINLLPIPPLDGAEAWRIVPLLRAHLRKRAVVETRQLDAAQTKALLKRSDDEEPSEELGALVEKILEDAKKGDGPTS